MKKKTRAAASSTAKLRKAPPAKRKVAPRGPRAAITALPAGSHDAKSTIRRLKTQFARGQDADRPRFGRWSDPRSAVGTGPSAGRGGQRDVCAQGAAAA